MEYPGDADASELTPNFGRPHIVLLGAGASKAAFPNGDINGKQLPLMPGFIETVGMERLAEKAGISWQQRNFEDFFNDLFEDPSKEEVRLEIEAFVWEYFSGLELPDEPTIYDYLVLGLRPKDVIATFNWDPFLFLAMQRNFSFLRSLPQVRYLHGNVCWLYKEVNGADPRVVPYNRPLPEAGFKRIPLLFPIKKKDYQADPFIRLQWDLFSKGALPAGYLFTVFGYGAPSSDVEAVQLLKQGWGTAIERNLEEFEVIDRPGMDDEQLRSRWEAFIHTHHYETYGDYFECSIAQMPRRSCEGMWTMKMDARFMNPNPQPKNVSLDVLQKWHKELIDQEAVYQAH